MKISIVSFPLTYQTIEAVDSKKLKSPPGSSCCWEKEKPRPQGQREGELVKAVLEEGPGAEAVVLGRTLP